MKKLSLIPVLFAILLCNCSSQDDADALFSDTEKAIIKTLIYADPPDDPTSNYDQDANAAVLGQMLFWDTQFSGAIEILGNRTTSPTNFSVGQEKRISCATCHVPSFGWADNTTKPNDVSLGINFTTRNSPTILNTAYNTYSTWDGSTDSVWGVARNAIEGSPHRFNRAGVAYVMCFSDTAGEGNYITKYNAIFGAASGNLVAGAGVCNCLNGNAPASGNGYGSTVYSTTCNAFQTEINTIFVNFSKAIAAYERLIVSKNSPFDQWANGNENAMTVAQKRGLKVFIGKGNCVRCHSGPNFSDGKFHNLGVPQVGGLSGSNDQGRYDGIGTLVTGANAFINSSTSFDDSGSATNRVTGLSATSTEIGQFKTPTLRSVNKTPPYFHNGTVASLWDVVNFYNFAGNAGNFPGTKDTILTTRHMTNEEMEDLVSFLRALEGESLSSSLTSSTAPGTPAW